MSSATPADFIGVRVSGARVLHPGIQRIEIVLLRVPIKGCHY